MHTNSLRHIYSQSLTWCILAPLPVHPSPLTHITISSGDTRSHHGSSHVLTPTPTQSKRPFLLSPSPFCLPVVIAARGLLYLPLRSFLLNLLPFVGPSRWWWWCQRQSQCQWLRLRCRLLVRADGFCRSAPSVTDFSATWSGEFAFSRDFGGLF